MESNHPDIGTAHPMTAKSSVKLLDRTTVLRLLRKEKLNGQHSTRVLPPT